MKNNDIRQRVNASTYKKITDIKKADEKDQQVSVMLRVSPHWKAPEGLRVFSHTGEFVTGQSDSVTFEELLKDPEVIRAEINLRKGRLG